MEKPPTPHRGVGAHPGGARFGVDDDLLIRVLAEAMSRGADHADLFLQHRTFHAITLEDGIVSRAATGAERGVGVRALVEDQTGYAYSEDLTSRALRQAARTAASIAQGGGRAPPQALVERRGASLYEIEEPWASVDLERKMALLRRTEGLVRGLDPAVERVSLAWQDADEDVLVATSEGAFLADRRPMSHLVCTVTASRDGRRETNASSLAGRRGLAWYTEERLREFCRRLVERTMILFEARRPPAGEMPVVLAAGASAILLHEAIGHGLEADFNRKGVSIYGSLLGRRVAPAEVTVVDSALHTEERGALNFDDEGALPQETVLVEEGVLRSYLHDRISARHYGVAPTGSGRRQSFRHAPMPRMRCTYLRPGTHTSEEIVASVERGIVAETFTNGQVAIGAGDFTFYLKNGWLVEGGKITAPIKDVNVIGNGPEALRRITMVGSDLQMDTGGWTCGKNGQFVPVSQGMPTALVSHLTVGGEDV